MVPARILEEDDNQCLASWYNIFIQIRWGDLTRASLDAVERHLRALQVRYPRARGGLAIMTPTAPIPATEIRDAQGRLFRELMQDGTWFCGVIIPALDTGAPLKRAIFKTMTTSMNTAQVPVRQLRNGQSTREVFPWLVENTAPGSPTPYTAAQLEEVVQDLRKRIGKP